MASNDAVDFSTKIQVVDDQNKELLQIGLTQKKTLMVLIGMIGVFFFILVAFNAISTKDLTTIVGLVKANKGYFVKGNTTN